MTVARIVHFVAGALILLSVALYFAAGPWALVLAGFVGANLLQSSLTRWCLLAVLLRKAGVPEDDGAVARAA